MPPTQSARITLARQFVRHFSYPLVFGASSASLLQLAANSRAFWLWAPVVAMIGIASVAALERIQPYQCAWLKDYNDTLPDVLHAVTSLTLIFLSAQIVDGIREVLPLPSVWPRHWPIWASVFAAGAIIDFGLWVMHRASHRYDWLWRLHALHHSSERLYFLNGERRHPFSAILLAAPGLTVSALLGAPAVAIGCWMAIISVHLAFQHANLDYSLGPFRYLLGVAEIHRWHHKREYENAQVNFGEFWMIWDHLAGTFHHRQNGVDAGDVGLRSEHMPTSYVMQLMWPFIMKRDS